MIWVWFLDKTEEEWSGGKKQTHVNQMWRQKLNEFQLPVRFSALKEKLIKIGKTKKCTDELTVSQAAGVRVLQLEASAPETLLL